MNKQQWMALGYWIMISFVIVTCVFIIYYLKNEAYSCLKDPMNYYAQKVGQDCFCIDRILKFP